LSMRLAVLDFVMLKLGYSISISKNHEHFHVEYTFRHKLSSTNN